MNPWEKFSQPTEQPIAQPIQQPIQQAPEQTTPAPWEKFTSDAVDTNGFSITMTPSSQRVEQPKEVLDVSEEFTGTLAPTQSPYSRSGTIEGLKDPTQQGVMGLVKGGAVAMDMVDSVPSPLEVIMDPLRIVDYGTPFANFGIMSAEWLANQVGDMAEGVTEQLTGEAQDIDVTLPRIKGEFGSYPERKSSEYKALAEDKKALHNFINKWEKTYKKKHRDATPIVTEVLSYAPDLLSLGMSSVLNIPKYAGVVEAALSSSREEVAGGDESDVATAKVLGYAGGYYGTKVGAFLLDTLSPAEGEMIRRFKSGDPREMEAHIELLKYYMDNPSISPQLMKSGNTGNPLVDERLTFMRQRMDTQAFNEFVSFTQSMATKSKNSIIEVTEEFSKGSKKLHDNLRNNADAAWDSLGEAANREMKIPSMQLTQSLDTELKDAPDVIKGFYNKLIKKNIYSGQLKDIDNEIAVLKKEFDEEIAAAVTPESRSALKHNYSMEYNELKSAKTRIKGLEAEDNLQYSALDLIEMNKKLNNKEYVAGGNININDKKQAHYMNKIRETINKRLEGLADSDEFMSLYKHANSASKDLYSTLGYANGKNKGKQVFNSELGKILEEELPGQIRIVEGMLNDTPSVYLSKMENLKGKLPDSSLKHLNEAYMQSKIKGMIDYSGDMPKLSGASFEKSIGEILDVADGRQLVESLYGKDKLQNLTTARNLNRELMKSKGKDIEVSPRTLMQWTRDLPKIITGTISQRMSDYFYATRLLKAYKANIGFDYNKFMADQVATTGATAVAGALVAPEGYELEGLLFGAASGKRLHYAYTLGTSRVGKAVTKSSHKWLKEAYSKFRTKKKMTQSQKTQVLNEKMEQEISKKVSKGAGRGQAERETLDEINSLLKDIDGKAVVAGAAVAGAGIATEAEASSEMPMPNEAPTQQPQSEAEQNFNAEDYKGTEQNFINIVQKMPEEVQQRAQKYGRALIIIHQNRQPNESVIDTIKRVVPGDTPPSEFLDTYRDIYGN